MKISHHCQSLFQYRFESETQLLLLKKIFFFLEHESTRTSSFAVPWRLASVGFGWWKVKKIQ